MNTLYYGDNRDILRKLEDESVDLIYLDPPFNSNQNYNVLFSEKSGEKSAAQITAFEDTWEWNPESRRWFDLVLQSGGKVADLLDAYYRFLGTSTMMAYLANMAPCLIELKRVLKSTGSIYLHCDPTASHYLKNLMDAVFGPACYRNEIIWKRTSSHNDSKKWPSIHDTLLYYAGKGHTWNPIYLDHDPEYVRKFYRYEDERGRYRLHEIIRTASMGPRPNLAYEYKGYTPEWGWRMIKQKVKALDKEGRLEWSGSGRPYLKRYLNEQEGTLASSIWTDIPPLSGQAAERLGFQTQKPEALLERIISASSNHGDVVLDPFCGCGTAVAVAQKLDRKWIGIDITHLAVKLTKRRLLDSNGLKEKKDYRVEGEPTDLEGAKALAEQDKFRFQEWALGQVDARPVGGVKRGADGGIDGKRRFRIGTEEYMTMLISVKGGGVGVKDIRELRAILDREKADIGLLITLEPPTRPMKTEAADAGHYEYFWREKHLKSVDKKARSYHPRIQILTIKELLEGKKPDLPVTAFHNATDDTFQTAPKSKKKTNGNGELHLD
ncbi:MAG: restriction endonuclease [Calditrichaeota bacterium]|nr:restriction endonuclease [Calditrichota bacterium]